MSPANAQDHRQVPPLDDENARILSNAFAKWRGDPEPPFEPLFPFRDPAPPWVLAPPYSDPDDAAVLAAVFALNPVAPTKKAAPAPWLVRALLRESDAGPPILDRVTVEHFDDRDAEVTGTVLRQLPLGLIRDRARTNLVATVHIREAVPDYFDPEDVAWARQAGAKLLLRRGNAGYPPEHYRRVAQLAIDIANDRRDVLQALAEKLKRRPETIKRDVRRARELGFLQPTTKGRANFTPGPNLYRKDPNDG